MATNDELNKLTKRFDAVLNVLLAQQRKDGVTAQEQIFCLAEVGLKDTEIAAIFGKTRGYVSSVLSSRKKVR